jgi:hypothetical protein
MVALETTEPRRRSRTKRVMSALDRIGLGLIYAFVVAVIPMTAVGLWTRTV